MLTGVWSAKHGVLSNHFTRPPRYPHFFQRIKAVQPGLRTVSIVNWAPINDNILSSNAVDRAQSAKTDQEVAGLVIDELANHDPDVVFVQLDEVDHAGHTSGYGPHHPSYLKAIGAEDRLVGDMLRALESRKTYERENWLILMSADHGGIGTGHGGLTPEETTDFFIANGPSVIKGELKKAPAVVDVAVTALTHLNISIDPQWNLDGKAVGIKIPARR
jgi:predicted AlkP superfamily pyrophosphatase or phosphodiesterase